ncbi:unnamed protein product [Amoebophrya sp. A25]|nr:unnamed protein product [Amoebophrya sp. A25]|eukprot:GSA25T00006135001.1
MKSTTEQLPHSSSADAGSRLNYAGWGVDASTLTLRPTTPGVNGARTAGTPKTPLAMRARLTPGAGGGAGTVAPSPLVPQQRGQQNAATPGRCGEPDQQSDSSSDGPEPLEWPDELKALPLMRAHEQPLVARSALPWPAPALRKMDIPEWELDPSAVFPLLDEIHKDSGHSQFVERVKELVGASDSSTGGGGTVAGGDHFLGSVSYTFTHTNTAGGADHTFSPLSPKHARSPTDLVGLEDVGPASLQAGVVVYIRPGTMSHLLPNRYVDLMQLTQGADGEVEELCVPLIEPQSAAGRKLWISSNLAFSGAQALADSQPESALAGCRASLTESPSTLEQKRNKQKCRIDALLYAQERGGDNSDPEVDAYSSPSLFGKLNVVEKAAQADRLSNSSTSAGAASSSSSSSIFPGESLGIPRNVLDRLKANNRPVSAQATGKRGRSMMESHHWMDREDRPKPQRPSTAGGNMTPQSSSGGGAFGLGNGTASSATPGGRAAGGDKTVSEILAGHSDIYTSTSPKNTSPLRNTTANRRRNSTSEVDRLLAFDSHFESGNLAAAVLSLVPGCGSGTHVIPKYELILDEDTNSNGNTQWFFFAVRNALAGETIDFSIVNLGKQDSLYKQGMRPLCYSQRTAESKKREVDHLRRKAEQEAASGTGAGKGGAGNSNGARPNSSVGARGGAVGWHRNFRKSSGSIWHSAVGQLLQRTKTVGGGTSKSRRAEADNAAQNEQTIQEICNLPDTGPVPLCGWTRCGEKVTYESAHITKKQIRTKLHKLRTGDYIGVELLSDDILWKYATPDSNFVTGQAYIEGPAAGGMSFGAEGANSSEGESREDAGSADRRVLQRLNFRYTFQHDNDTVYFAYTYPYTFTRLNRFLESLSKETSYTTMLCRTLSHNWVDVVTVTDRSKPSKGKSVIFVTARVHPGETPASYIMEGFLKFLTHPHDKRAAELRKYFIFKCVPMLNPDGVVCGNYRTSLVGCDLNRRWRHDSKTLHPSIWYTKRLLKRLHKDFGNVCCFVDLHGHSRRLGWFTYGCTTQDMGSGNSRDPRLLPFALRRVSNTFSLQNSNFAMPACKDTTARVTVATELDVLAYTVEASLGGGCKRPEHGEPDFARQNVHFTASDYVRMGVDLALNFLTRIPKQQKTTGPKPVVRRRIKQMTSSGGVVTEVDGDEEGNTSENQTSGIKAAGGKKSKGRKISGIFSGEPAGSGSVTATAEDASGSANAAGGLSTQPFSQILDPAAFMDPTDATNSKQHADHGSASIIPAVTKNALVGGGAAVPTSSEPTSEVERAGPNSEVETVDQSLVLSGEEGTGARQEKGTFFDPQDPNSDLYHAARKPFDGHASLDSNASGGGIFGAANILGQSLHSTTILDTKVLSGILGGAGDDLHRKGTTSLDASMKTLRLLNEDEEHGGRSRAQSGGHEIEEDQLDGFAAAEADSATSDEKQVFVMPAEEVDFDFGQLEEELGHEVANVLGMSTHLSASASGGPAGLGLSVSGAGASCTVPGHDSESDPDVQSEHEEEDEFLNRKRQREAEQAKLAEERAPRGEASGKKRKRKRKKPQIVRARYMEAYEQGRKQSGQQVRLPSPAEVVLEQGGEVIFSDGRVAQPSRGAATASSNSTTTTPGGVSKAGDSGDALSVSTTSSVATKVGAPSATGAGGGPSGSGSGPSGLFSASTGVSGGTPATPTPVPIRTYEPSLRGTIVLGGSSGSQGRPSLAKRRGDTKRGKDPTHQVVHLVPTTQSLTGPQALQQSGGHLGAAGQLIGSHPPALVDTHTGTSSSSSSINKIGNFSGNQQQIIPTLSPPPLPPSATLPPSAAATTRGSSSGPTSGYAASSATPPSSKWSSAATINAAGTTSKGWGPFSMTPGKTKAGPLPLATLGVGVDQLTASSASGDSKAGLSPSKMIINGKAAGTKQQQEPADDELQITREQVVATATSALLSSGDERALPERVVFGGLDPAKLLDMQQLRSAGFAPTFDSESGCDVATETDAERDALLKSNCSASSRAETDVGKVASAALSAVSSSSTNPVRRQRSRTPGEQVELDVNSAAEMAMNPLMRGSGEVETPTGSSKKRILIEQEEESDVSHSVDMTASTRPTTSSSSASSCTAGDQPQPQGINTRGLVARTAKRAQEDTSNNNFISLAFSTPGEIEAHLASKQRIGSGIITRPTSTRRRSSSGASSVASSGGGAASAGPSSASSSCSGATSSTTTQLLAKQLRTVVPGDPSAERKQPKSGTPLLLIENHRPEHIHSMQMSAGGGELLGGSTGAASNSISDAEQVHQPGGRDALLESGATSAAERAAAASSSTSGEEGGYGTVGLDRKHFLSVHHDPGRGEADGAGAKDVVDQALSKLNTAMQDTAANAQSGSTSKMSGSTTSNEKKDHIKENIERVRNFPLRQKQCANLSAVASQYGGSESVNKDPATSSPKSKYEGRESANPNLVVYPAPATEASSSQTGERWLASTSYANSAKLPFSRSIGAKPAECEGRVAPGDAEGKGAATTDSIVYDEGVVDGGSLMLPTTSSAVAAQPTTSAATAARPLTLGATPSRPPGIVAGPRPVLLRPELVHAAQPQAPKQRMFTSVHAQARSTQALNLQERAGGSRPSTAGATSQGKGAKRRPSTSGNTNSRSSGPQLFAQSEDFSQAEDVMGTPLFPIGAAAALDVATLPGGAMGITSPVRPVSAGATVTAASSRAKTAAATVAAGAAAPMNTVEQGMDEEGGLQIVNLNARTGRAGAGANGSWATLDSFLVKPPTPDSTLSSSNRAAMMVLGAAGVTGNAVVGAAVGSSRGVGTSASPRRTGRVNRIIAARIDSRRQRQKDDQKTQLEEEVVVIDHAPEAEQHFAPMTNKIDVNLGEEVVLEKGPAEDAVVGDALLVVLLGENVKNQDFQPGSTEFPPESSTAGGLMPGVNSVASSVLIGTQQPGLKFLTLAGPPVELGQNAGVTNRPGHKNKGRPGKQTGSVWETDSVSSRPKSNSPQKQGASPKTRKSPNAWAGNMTSPHLLVRSGLGVEVMKTTRESAASAKHAEDGRGSSPLKTMATTLPAGFVPPVTTSSSTSAVGRTSDSQAASPVKVEEGKVNGNGPVAQTLGVQPVASSKTGDSESGVVFSITAESSASTEQQQQQAQIERDASAPSTGTEAAGVVVMQLSDDHALGLNLVAPADSKFGKTPSPKKKTPGAGSTTMTRKFNMTGTAAVSGGSSPSKRSPSKGDVNSVRPSTSPTIGAVGLLSSLKEEGGTGESGVEHDEELRQPEIFGSIKHHMPAKGAKVEKLGDGMWIEDTSVNITTTTSSKKLSALRSVVNLSNAASGARPVTPNNTGAVGSRASSSTLSRQHQKGFLPSPNTLRTTTSSIMRNLGARGTPSLVPKRGKEQTFQVASLQSVSKLGHSSSLELSEAEPVFGVVVSKTGIHASAIKNAAQQDAAGSPMLAADTQGALALLREACSPKKLEIKSSPVAAALSGKISVSGAEVTFPAMKKMLDDIEQAALPNASAAGVARPSTTGQSPRGVSGHGMLTKSSPSVTTGAVQAGLAASPPPPPFSNVNVSSSRGESPLPASAVLEGSGMGMQHDAIAMTSKIECRRKASPASEKNHLAVVRSLRDSRHPSPNKSPVKTTSSAASSIGGASSSSAAPSASAPGRSATSTSASSSSAKAPATAGAGVAASGESAEAFLIKPTASLPPVEQKTFGIYSSYGPGASSSGAGATGDASSSSPKKKQGGSSGSESEASSGPNKGLETEEASMFFNFETEPDEASQHLNTSRSTSRKNAPGGREDSNVLVMQTNSMILEPVVGREKNKDMVSGATGAAVDVVASSSSSSSGEENDFEQKTKDNYEAPKGQSVAAAASNVSSSPSRGTPVGQLVGGQKTTSSSSPSTSNQVLAWMKQNRPGTSPHERASPRSRGSLSQRPNSSSGADGGSGSPALGSRGGGALSPKNSNHPAGAGGSPSQRQQILLPGSGMELGDRKAVDASSLSPQVSGRRRRSRGMAGLLYVPDSAIEQVGTGGEVGISPGGMSPGEPSVAEVFGLQRLASAPLPSPPRGSNKKKQELLAAMGICISPNLEELIDDDEGLSPSSNGGASSPPTSLPRITTSTLNPPPPRPPSATTRHLNNPTVVGSGSAVAEQRSTLTSAGISSTSFGGNGPWAGTSSARAAEGMTVCDREDLNALARILRNDNNMIMGAPLTSSNVNNYNNNTSGANLSSSTFDNADASSTIAGSVPASPVKQVFKSVELMSTNFTEVISPGRRAGRNGEQLQLLGPAASLGMLPSPSPPRPVTAPGTSGAYASGRAAGSGAVGGSLGTTKLPPPIPKPPAALNPDFVEFGARDFEVALGESSPVKGRASSTNRTGAHNPRGGPPLFSNRDLKLLSSTAGAMSKSKGFGSGGKSSTSKSASSGTPTGAVASKKSKSGKKKSSSSGGTTKSHKS